MADIQLSGSIGAGGAFPILGEADPEIVGDADLTLSLAEYSNLYLEVTSDGTSTAIRNVIAPLNKGTTFIVRNATTEGFAIILKGSTGTGVSIPSGDAATVATDGVNYFAPTGGAGAGAIAVANAAALTAFPAAGLPNGQTASVQSYGALFALGPSGLTVDGVTVVAASDGRVWQRGPTLIGPQALAQADWYWDPQAGSDEASGLVGHPLATFGEIVRRYGTSTPTLPVGQSVTVHLLTAQTTRTDPVAFRPTLSVGGQAILLGTLIALQAPFVGGVVTPKVKGGPGTLLQVASMPAGVAANQLVQNVTRNSYAFIDSMAGSVATMQQPLTAASLTTVNVPAAVSDNAWATGDTLAVWDVPLCNLTEWNPVATDETVGGAKASVGWCQWIRISDSSGTGSSIYGHCSRAVANVLSSCRVDPRVILSALNGRGQNVYCIGSTFLQLVQVESGVCSMQGGGIAGTGFTNNGGGGALLGNDIIIHHALELAGLTNFSGVYADGGTLALNIGGQMQGLTANALWGPTGVDLTPGSHFVNGSGLSWVAMLTCSGALTISGVTTGSVYTGSGVMVDGITITAANIDAGGVGGKGMFNPRTAAGYF